MQVHAALQACNLSSARAAARAEGFLQLIVGSRDFAIWQAKIDKESALLYDGLVSQDLRGHASDRLREDYADVEVSRTTFSFRVEEKLQSTPHLILQNYVVALLYNRLGNRSIHTYLSIPCSIST